MREILNAIFYILAVRLWLADVASRLTTLAYSLLLLPMLAFDRPVAADESNFTAKSALTRVGDRQLKHAAIVDSKSLKTTQIAQEVGYDGGKLVKGHKRHIIVDTLGLLLEVVVSAAFREL